MVVDRYDELVTNQFDRPGMAADRALSQLYQEAQAGRLDLTLVSHLVQIIGIYPLYSLVALNTGERGIVTQISPGQLHEPVVTLIWDAQGKRYSTPTCLDLAQQPPGEPPRSIVDVLNEEKEGVRVEELLAHVMEIETPR